MSNLPNNLQWPPIKVFARVISHPLERFVDNCDLAARTIQYHVRRHQRGLSSTMPYVSGLARKGFYPSWGSKGPWTRYHLMSYFCDPEAAFASIKLDGTNLGISAGDGTLYGRRMQIGNEADSYQRTDITFLRGRGKEIECFREALGLPKSVILRLYGELVCNNVFGYDKQEEGLYKGFRVFGAVANVSSLSVLQSKENLRQLQSELGLAASKEENSAVIVIQANDAFRELLSACTDKGADSRSETKFATLQEFSRGSLISIVQDTFDWMVGCMGEGLVLTWKWHKQPKKSASDHEDYSFITAKYKTAAEDQGSTSVVIEKTLTCVEEFCGRGLEYLLPPGTDTLLRLLLTVSTAKPVSGSKQPSIQSKPEKNKKQRTELHAEVNESLKSALTKFDSPTEYFVQPGGRQMLINLLMEEMRHDLTTDSKAFLEEEEEEKQHDKKSADSDVCKSTGDHLPTEKQLLKALRGAVEKFVGTSYGAWKKAQIVKSDA